MSKPRIARRQVDGVLLLDKPLNLTSNAALQRVRRLYAAQRAGHSGTLDPLATGLLPILFGEATKFGAELLDSDKRYRAEVAFGTRTSTGDAEGEVLATAPVTFTQPDLEQVVARFTGTIEQVPPMYSALKHAGRPLYDYARAGEEVVRKPRSVTIHELTLIEAAEGRAVLDVLCSKGTYVRTLAEDIGEALGCGAHLAGLRRTGVGPFELEEAYTLEALEAMAPAQRDAALLPVDVLLQHLPSVMLSPEEAIRLNRGQALKGKATPAGRVRLYGGENFLGLGEGDGKGGLRPRRLLRAPGS